MKKIYAVLLFVVAIFLCSVSYEYDRFEYIARDAEQNEYYLDIQSIAYTNNPDIIRFWAKIEISKAGRKDYVAKENNITRKNMLKNLSERKDCLEINFQQNTNRIVESIFYDAKGHILEDKVFSQNYWEGWGSIPPNSIIETMCDVVKRIIQSNTQRTPRQPFVAPQPQPAPRIPQPRAPQPRSGLPLNTPEQQESYCRLQEYNAWVSSQPDFPEFEQWFNKKSYKRLV